MRSYSEWIAALSGALLLGGCATSTPPALVDARRAYSMASAGLAATMTPTELDDARAMLDRANREFSLKGDTQLARDYAYIARRRIDLANAEARMLIDRQLIAEAQRQGVQAVDPLASVPPMREAQREEEATPAAETEAAPPEAAPPESPRERLVGAMRELAEVEEVKEDGRGVVITLTERELFGPNRWELTDQARARLDRVAEVLRSQTWDKRVVVEGHTDDLGTDASLKSLSVARAHAVHDYLILAGVEPRKIAAVGRGGHSPVVGNTSAENRAHNRRVEIVVQPGSLSRR